MRVGDIYMRKEKNLFLEKINILNSMERSIFKSLFSLFLIFLLLLWGIVPIIVLAIFGIDYTTLEDIPKVIIAFLSDIGLISIFIKIYYKNLKEDFKNFFNKDIVKHLKIAFRYWGIGMIVMVISNFIISVITGGQLAENEETVRSLIDIFPLYMAFQLMVYAPITEELIFRKSIRDISKNKWFYVITSGFVFGGLHVLSSITSVVDLLYLIPYCSLGFAFALLYTRTNNIFSSMTIHAFHNGLALILYLGAMM